MKWNHLLLLLFVLLVFSNHSVCSTNVDQEFVPQWAKSAIWYQIFPERFRDGDPTNNPTVNDILGADPAIPPKAWNIHPWGSDWYQRQPYELINGEKDIAVHLLRRRYGGDIQGILDKLDYLESLGITAVYLNPVFDSPSLHKYDGASYHHIDPNFGPDPEGDRKLIATEDPLDPKTWVWTSADKLALELISELHKRNIKVIFDGVFNHLGINSFAFKSVDKLQQASPFASWLEIKQFRDEAAGKAFEYEGWFGVKSLPVWKENENGIVSGPREYIFHATQRWMNPDNKGIEFGIDGWRLDVAYDVHHNFWKDWRKLVKSINPNAYLTAEIVDKPEKVKPYLQGDEFDGEMNYNFAFTAAEFLFNPAPMNITATEFDKKLKDLQKLYPQGVAYVNQNLFGSHDSNRIASHIVNRGIGNFRDWGYYFGRSQAINNPNYKINKPSLAEIQLQKLFVVLQMTYVGAPMIYYGDEVGMWGANDPDCRKPMLWEDIKYSQEVYLPNGNKRARDKYDQVAINQDLFKFYQKLIKIRRDFKSLQIGDFTHWVVDNDKNSYGYKRSYNDESVWVLLNNSEDNQTYKLDFAPGNLVKELISGVTLGQQEQPVRFTVPAKSGAIFIIIKE